MTTMYDVPLEWEVKEIHPSGLVSYQGGKASATRQFDVPCRYAEEFALRQLGKWWDGVTYLSPRLPAPYPTTGGIAAPDVGYGRMSLVAKSFSINPLCVSCFNNLTTARPGVDTDIINDPTSLVQNGVYFYRDDMELSNADCRCNVTIGYEENPCDCAYWDSSSFYWEVNNNILTHTCISVVRNPAYELFTLPNTNLVWADEPDGPDRALKNDSYALMMISKADIIVYWHNIPVKDLCIIETYLRSYRQTVNSVDWGSVLLCAENGSASEECAEGDACCEDYEAETIMFIDFEEDRSYRTDAFSIWSNIKMDTTTLKLHFKQKRVVDPVTGNVFGWNHLFNDRQDVDPGNDYWGRVKIDKGGGGLRDLYTKKDFVNIFNPAY